MSVAPVITYIVLVISIGLLVDFILHVLMRYYESECDTREEKVKDALGTMGASILVGGLSTFLGVTPLLFSKSEIFSTVCISFLAMVTLGVSHGLVVLPVILSYVGTEDVCRHRKRLSLIQISQALSTRFHLSKDSSSRHAMNDDD
jgi:predicted RND superfamily exporter protein